MCGIVGFTGNRQAAPILLDGLSKLEYRGYDSAGLAVRDGENLAQVVKAKGRLSNLIEKTDGGKALKGTCGIGHTRWATHGKPSQTNAHPHVSGNCTRSGSGTVESEVVGVHNGIIENYTELKEKLLKHGYTFYSQTDRKVANMKFGEKVRDLRKKHSLTQDELAQCLGINKRTIIGWERDGRYPRSIEMLEKMADIFHVPLTYLQPDQSLFIERAAEAYGKKGKIEAQHLAFELTELFASGELTPQDMDGIMYEMHKAYFKYREQKREKERIMNL